MSHTDVIIVGAGLSGIGAAVHLQKYCPNKSLRLLEGRDAIGGTWDLFRYPGIRSDSDMHTLGYSFKPWTEAKAIADGPSIRRYVNETADEHNIRERISFGHQVKSAAWSTSDSTWTVTCEHEGKIAIYTCNFLFMCGGYYNYDKPHRPEFKGAEDFGGQVIHPQFWPEDLDYSGKRVAIIGSGATAMTMVPAMAERGARVTMVQRSPTYVVSMPAEDRIANFLRKVLPPKLAYRLTRFKNITLTNLFYNKTRSQPEKVKKQLLKMIRASLGDDIVAKHFTPSYKPWDQRLCLIPDGDLYSAIRNETAHVVTAEIDCFTKDGIRLADGSEVGADIIVTATGLQLTVLSNITVTVDGDNINFPDTVSYKGMMYSGIPNLAQTFGYINASWTLRADMTAEYVCRLLNRMDELDVRQVTPTLRREDEDMVKRPWIDDFPAGYMQRSMHLFPKQGEGPWRNTQNYALDRKMVRNAPIDDDALLFSNPEKQALPDNVTELRSKRDAA